MVLTTPLPPTPPLGPDDFDAQDAELDALRERHEEIPQWEFCEGFLAALVCTRRVVAPDEYWPVLLGDDFNPVHHMEFVWRWRRRWVEVAAALDEPVETLEDERTYRPEVLDTRGAVLALPEAERGETNVESLPSYGQVWALGFMYAVETWPEDWSPPSDPDAARMLDNALGAIVALTEGDSRKADRVPVRPGRRAQRERAAAGRPGRRHLGRVRPAPAVEEPRSAGRDTCANSLSPDATIPARAAAARNTRSATARC